MTGDTDFMRPILRILGLDVPDSVGDDDIFLYIEEKIGSQDISFPKAWGSLRQEFNQRREEIRASKDKIAVVLIGKHNTEVMHSQWQRCNDWKQDHWNRITDSGSFQIGKQLAVTEQEELDRRLVSARITSNTETRLIEGIRYVADCDPEHTVNKNVFLRRLSEGFKLRHDLDPDISHSSEIQEQLASLDCQPDQPN